MRIAGSDAARAACFAIRRSVFIEEQGVPEAEEMDALDAQAVHFLLTDAGGPVGTARLLFPSASTAKIGRVAVLKPFRGRGLGRLLMEAALAEAARRGAHKARLHAQVSTLPFYERLGFAVEGEVFSEAGIPHRAMAIRLTTTIPTDSEAAP